MTTIAVFDLDGTITNGDTFVAYLAHVLRQRPYRIWRCAALPLVAAGYAAGAVGNDAVKLRLLDAVVGGSVRTDVERFTATFVGPCIRRMVKPAALQRIATHTARGDILVMATAGIDIYAQALGHHLGFHHILATRARWRAGQLAFGLDGPNLRGRAKVAAVETILAGMGAPRPQVIAYSDHHSDLPLLRYADHGIAVDPTRTLRKAIVDLAIPIEHWRV